MKALTGLKFSKIDRGSIALAALGCLKNSPYNYNGRNVVSTLMLSFLDGCYHSCMYQGKLEKLK